MSKRTTRSASTSSRHTQGNTPPMLPPGYGPRASIPSVGFFPDPNVLTSRRQLSQQLEHQSSDNNTTIVPSRHDETAHRIPDSLFSQLGSNLLLSKRLII